MIENVKHLLFLSYLIKLKFYRQTFENTEISNFKKIRPVGLRCSMQTDRHDKANSGFLQSCEHA